MEESSALVEEFVEEVTDDGPDKLIINLSQLTMNNLDPLEYFSRFLDIPEMIFHHLNGKDLIKISEVNPTYFTFIASSKVLMKKIKVVFDKRLTRHSENFDLMKNSLRLYQNIELSYDVHTSKHKSKKLKFFLRKTHKWKDVKVIINNDTERYQSWNFLSSIQSVESLSVINKNIYCNPFPYHEESVAYKSFNALKFPKLKHLKIYISDNSILEENYTISLMNSAAIEKLEYEDSFTMERISGKMIRNIENLTKMLKNFGTLTSLSLKSGNLNRVFKNECWKDFPFKLKSLTVAYPLIIKYFRVRNPRINFRNFLEAQSGYLEELTIDPRLDMETFEVIMKMPKLKSLCLEHVLVSCVNETPRAISSSITDLKIKLHITANSLKYLLLAMPNIRTLTLNSINEEHFEMLKSINKKLKILTVCHFIGVGRKEVEKVLL